MVRTRPHKLILRFLQFLDYDRRIEAPILFWKFLGYVQAFLKAHSRSLQVAGERQKITHCIEVIGLLMQVSKSTWPQHQQSIP